MKILVAPDKFKGTVTSAQVCEALRKGLLVSNPAAEILSFPMADGGDGFGPVMAFYTDASAVSCQTIDALGRPIQASYYLSDDGDTAIIELASASGLVLIEKESRDIMRSSTLGTGVMIRNAIEKGATTIILGIGGSATNDGGMGILHAFGWRFFDGNHQLLDPVAENLLRVEKIDWGRRLPHVGFELAVDVQNPLTGPDGAAQVYAPQKGATEQQVRQLDEGLSHFASILKRETGVLGLDNPGMGAAGGVPAGLSAFLNVNMSSGAEMVIERSGMLDDLADADVIVTGEGKLDEQTMAGKLVYKIAQLAASHGVPCLAVCGQSESKETGLFRTVYALTDIAGKELAIEMAEKLLRQLSERIGVEIKKMLPEV